MLGGKKNKLEGPVTDYKLPTNMPHLYKIHGQVSWEKNKQPKSTYLSDIFTRAKKPGGYIPGPSDYDTTKTESRNKHGNSTKRYQVPKEKKETFLAATIRLEKSRVGPNQYSPEIKRKVPGTYENREDPGSMNREIEYLSTQTPAANYYTLND